MSGAGAFSTQPDPQTAAPASRRALARNPGLALALVPSASPSPRRARARRRGSAHQASQESDKSISEHDAAMRRFFGAIACVSGDLDRGDGFHRFTASDGEGPSLVSARHTTGAFRAVEARALR